MYEGIMKYNWDRFGDGLGGFIEERYIFFLFYHAKTISQKLFPQKIVVFIILVDYIL